MNSMILKLMNKLIEGAHIGIDKFDLNWKDR
jgi:hypothetical protein